MKKIPLTKGEAAKAYNEAAIDLHIECPACASTQTQFFHNFPRIPLVSLSLPTTREGALNAPKFPLNFYNCLACGHVYNVAFREHCLSYQNENNLMYNNGSSWRTYCQQLSESIDFSFGTVVDIGAGNGEFLTQVKKQNPDTRCIAFEPGLGALICQESGLETYQKLFVPSIDLELTQPNIIIWRHVCEHLQYPRKFIAELSYQAVQNSQQFLLLAEVPCIEKALKQGRISDFFYEHPQHFTSRSFRKMFESCGWVTHDFFMAYNQEVVVWVGRPDPRAFVPQPREIEANAIRETINYLLATRDRVAFWGGTGKGAAFLNAYGVNSRFRVIDSDHRKAGRYVPGTGQLIEHSGSLLVNPVDTVIITTRWRAADIYAEIKRDYPMVKEILIVDGNFIREYTEADYFDEITV